MRTVYAIIIWICLIVFCSECDNMLVFILSKIIAAAVAAIAGKLLVKTMTDEELNEKV